MEVLIVDKIRLKFFSLIYLYKINVTNKFHHIVQFFLMINHNALIKIDVQENLMYDVVLMLLRLLFVDVQIEHYRLNVHHFHIHLQSIELPKRKTNFTDKKIILFVTFPMEKSEGTGANLLPNVILPGT